MCIKMESGLDNTAYPKNKNSQIVVYNQSQKGKKSLELVFALSEDFVLEREACCVWQ